MYVALGLLIFAILICSLLALVTYMFLIDTRTVSGCLNAANNVGYYLLCPCVRVYLCVCQGVPLRQKKKQPMKYIKGGDSIFPLSSENDILFSSTDGEAFPTKNNNIENDNNMENNVESQELELKNLDYLEDELPPDDTIEELIEPRLEIEYFE